MGSWATAATNCLAASYGLAVGVEPMDADSYQHTNLAVKLSAGTGARQYDIYIDPAKRCTVYGQQACYSFRIL